MTNLKAVRIVETAQIKRINLQFAKIFSKTLKQIIDNYDIGLSAFVAYSMPMKTYLDSFQKKSILHKINVTGEFDTNIYFFVEKETAIALANIMRMQTKGVIQEKIKDRHWGDQEKDSFGEIGNQLTGTLDRIVRENTNLQVHLGIDFDRFDFPQKNFDESFFVESDEYIVWTSNIKVQNLEIRKLNILFPKFFFEKMINQKVRFLGIDPQRILVHCSNQQMFEKLKEEKEDRYFRVEKVAILDEVLNLCKEDNVCALCIELPDLSIPLPHNFEIFLRRFVKLGVLRSLPVWFSVEKMNPELYDVLEQKKIPGLMMESAEECLSEWLQDQLTLETTP